MRTDKSLDHIPRVVISSQGTIRAAQNMNLNITPSTCILIFQMWSVLQILEYRYIFWHFAQISSF